MAANSSCNPSLNNLANIDTDGYKDETLTFGDIFAQTGVAAVAATLCKLDRVSRFFNGHQFHGRKS